MLNSIQSIASINFATTNPLARAGQFLLYPCQKLWATHHVTLVAKAGQNRFDYACSKVEIIEAKAPKWLLICALVLLIIPTFLGIGLIKAALAFDGDLRSRLQCAREIVFLNSPNTIYHNYFKNCKWAKKWINDAAYLFKKEMLDDIFEDYFEKPLSNKYYINDFEKEKIKLVNLLFEYFPENIEERFEKLSQCYQELNNFSRKVQLLIDESKRWAEIGENISDSKKDEETKKLIIFEKMKREFEKNEYTLILFDKEKIQDEIFSVNMKFIANELKLSYAAQWMHYIGKYSQNAVIVAQRILDNTDAFIEEFEGLVEPCYFDWMLNGEHDALLKQLLHRIDGKCQQSVKHASMLECLCKSLQHADEVAINKVLSMWSKAHFLDALTYLKLDRKLTYYILEYFLQNLNRLKVTPDEVTKVLLKYSLSFSTDAFIKAISRAPWVIIKEYLAIYRTKVLEKMEKQPYFSRNQLEGFLNQNLCYFSEDKRLDLHHQRFEYMLYFDTLRSILFFDTESFRKVYYYILTPFQRDVVRTIVNNRNDKDRFPIDSTVPTLRQITLSKLHSIYRFSSQLPNMPQELKEELNPTL